MTIALVGCGNMGSAILKGWKSAGIKEDIIIYDPMARHGDPVFYGTELFNKLGDFIKASIRADTVIMAVKPQIMHEVCLSIKPGVSGKALIISIAVGQTIEAFKNRFSDDQPIIRTMPNTPAAIGKGVTAAVACDKSTEAHKEKADRLLRASGHVEWLEDEALIDPVSTISGSGPAYVFLLMEVMAEAGTKLGLDKEMAMRLARQTVIGSASLAEKENQTPASKLRERVTSPGGTTQAALNVLMSGDVQNAFDKAVEAALKRSRELG